MAKKKKSPPKKKNNSTGLIFVGCMFLGIGIGLIAHEPAIGTLLGLGIGFIAMFFAKNL